MRASTRGLPGFLFALLCWGVAVSAQEKKEPSRRHSPAVTEPSDSTSRPLPKIDLPEFVITGNEVIDFKEFSKTGVDQSLSLKDESPQAGLNREPVTADLGGSWKEKAAFSAPAGGLNGRFSAGYGSFGTPSFDG
ncbi:MAG: hypothetical protein OEM41_03005, partial [Ignavibacteria bacterium]|nr:hypothetical protein [Ignavibacteria bacterium]